MFYLFSIFFNFCMFCMCLNWLTSGEVLTFVLRLGHASATSGDFRSAPAYMCVACISGISLPWRLVRNCSSHNEIPSPQTARSPPIHYRYNAAAFTASAHAKHQKLGEHYSWHLNSYDILKNSRVLSKWPSDVSWVTSVRS